MSSAGSGAPSPWRRWQAGVLAASLVLNGFLVGMVAVDWLRPHRGGSLTGERAVRFELRRFEQHLPSAAIDAIAAELRPLAPDLDARIERMRVVRAEIMALAAEPQPDRAALDEQLAALRAEAEAMQADVQRRTYDALLKLPADQRTGLAAAAGMP